MLYKLREAVFKLCNDYSSTVAEAKLKAECGRGLEILTPRHTFQRLLIALAEVKTGNTSENLLNEIRQFIYFLHRAK